MYCIGSFVARCLGEKLSLRLCYYGNVERSYSDHGSGWYMAFSLLRTFAPGNESSSCGTFIPWNFCSVVLPERKLYGTP